MDTRPPFIVFTDLDGTLLDHGTYDWRPARPALDALRALGVPVILASSKTAAEIAPLQRDMGLTGLPALVENGAGVLGPHEEAGASPPDYARIRAALDRLPKDIRPCFTGFGDLCADEVAALTGLSHAEAVRAQQRRFSEPGQWRGTDAQRATFLRLLAQDGISARQGGRFLTLSFGRTKADRMDQICARMGAARRVALGDAPNDIEMLEHADIGVVIANPHRSALPPLRGEEAGHILRTQAPGPVGWNGAIFDVIARMKEAVRHMTDG